ncbi:TPA: hypothetical protein ACH3X1_000165 [Trebouxia sp. C0004]
MQKTLACDPLPHLHETLQHGIHHPLMLCNSECGKSGYQHANVRLEGLPRNLHGAGSECDCILDNRFIICPVYVHDSHWIVIVLDLKLHRVFCLDPLDASGVSHKP